MQVASAELKPSEHARNIGVIFDPHVSLDRQIASVFKSAFYSIRAISRIRKFLSLDTVKTLVHALVTSKVDHCNAVLYGQPKCKIERLQYVLNSAAMLVTLTHKYDHITPVLMELHWLPVEQRIEYKILLYTHKVVHGAAPDYLKELLESYRPGRNLRSANKRLLKTQSYQLKTCGYRAFSVCAPNLWNSPPFDLRLLENVEGFKKALKTELFKRAYF